MSSSWKPRSSLLCADKGETSTGVAPSPGRSHVATLQLFEEPSGITGTGSLRSITARPWEAELLGNSDWTSFKAGQQEGRRALSLESLGRSKLSVPEADEAHGQAAPPRSQPRWVIGAVQEQSRAPGGSVPPSWVPQAWARSRIHPKSPHGCPCRAPATAPGGS